MTQCVCDGTTLKLVSLFDGIAGFPEAFRRAGVPTIATVEIDKAAAGVAADHFPEAKAFTDVTEATPDEILAAGFCPVHGVLSAGWPCTDLSLAGLRLGLGGARSGLVGEVFRLLVGLRPRWFVLENVPGLLSSACPCPGGGICAGQFGALVTTDNGDGTFTTSRKHIPCDAAHPVRGGSCGRRRERDGGLRRFAGPGRCMALHGGGMGTVLRRLGECGYGLAYRVLDAQNFGVPQRRRRVVIVGHLGDAAGPAEVLLEPEGRGGDSSPGVTQRAGTPGGTVVSTLAGGGRRGYRVDAESAAGGQLLTAGGGPVAYSQQGSKVGPAGALRTGGNRTNGAPFLAAPLTAREGKGPDSGVSSGNIVTHALTAEGADASEDRTGRGTPIVPVGFNETAGGNSVHEEVSPTIGAGMGGSATGGAYTLRADPGGVGQEHNTNFLNESAGVRRLTPTECERLQGFPDGWTATSHGRAQSDSARYRQLGNSIAVPVFAWVAERLVRVDRGETL